ncbi:poly(glycerol-phosphate) alpha-glucosyltransferase [Brevibacterium siliguriense]|uniref:Poly(Glycerol-phosphate) alpha-glucosyltransferase n=1 Tax=Brevibacterium siliguriense TaxID=1136497 RepID=A0A1H1QIY6_9MICO|nr:glycosyltransferase [Brevibacterium siliguriense]SDS23273.1 poly(glycerol-phosphate) alpha-glucosyltransferase [Brevibacterium siliguriense]
MNSIPETSPRQSHPHRFPHRGRLPEGSYFTLTWTIGYDYGGMTTVALERSSAFARLDNRRVEILTLSPEMKGLDRERELRAAGSIDRKVKVRNLWQDLTSWSDRKLRRMVGTVDPDPTAADDVIKRTGQEWTEQRNDSEDSLLQADRYHDRGHLLVIDRQDMKKPGRRGGRRITLFDREQTVIAQWSTAREFYQAWLDVVIGDKPSYLICDSAFVGNFIHEYRRDNVILCMVNHNHFLADANDAPTGALAEDKFGYLRQLDGFDLATTLTDSQRVAMEGLDLSSGKLATVSNLTDDLHGDPDRPRPRSRGSMVARLSPQKRVEDAIAAVASVVDDGQQLTLDVYGDGDDRPMLSELIESGNAAGRVTLHGHVDGAKSNFLSSSFSLLTSRFEGQGLVVLESMSAGCIPICYAVDYGPADIIEHGIDGFLVAPGDVDGLAAAISTFLSLPEDEVSRMRRNAVARAADFFHDPIVGRWGEVLAARSFVPIIRAENARAEVRTAEVTADGVSVTLSVSDLGGSSPEQMFISWKSRTGTFYGRVEAHGSKELVTADIPLSRIEPITDEYVDFSLDLVFGRGFERVRLACSEDSALSSSAALHLYSTKHGNLSGRFIRTGLTSTS